MLVIKDRSVAFSRTPSVTDHKNKLDLIGIEENIVVFQIYFSTSII